MLINFAKITYSLIAIFWTFVLIFLSFRVDFQTDWFLIVAIFILILFFLLALIDLKRLFLIILFFAPILYKFNDLKVNLAHFLPFIKEKYIPANPITIIYIAIILIGAVSIIAYFKKLKQLPFKIIILLFSIFVILSNIWSNYSQISFIYTLYFLVPVFCYIITFLFFKTKKDFLTIIKTIIFSSIFPALLGIYQFFSKNFFYHPDTNLKRLQGNFAHPNTYGLFLFLIIALLLILYFSKKNRIIKHNLPLLSYTLVLIILLVLTYSRVSWICLFIFIATLIFLQKRLLIFFTIMSPLAILSAFSIPNIRNRIFELSEFSVFNTWSSRVNIWRVAMKGIKEQPIFGHGIGVSETWIEISKPWIGGSSLPHNDYILYTFELGLIGLVFFTILTFSILVYLYFIQKNLNEKKIKLIGLGIFFMMLSMIPATIFESASQKQIIQIIIWSILGGLFAQFKSKISITNAVKQQQKNL